METSNSKSKDRNAIVEQTAKFCETVFNSKEFQELFTGDFDTDSKIYDLVGGAIMRYINATKDFNVDVVYKILIKIKNSNCLKQLNYTITSSDEYNLFSQFFSPEILKKIKATDDNIINGIAGFLVNMLDNYLLTNSFNGYNIPGVRAKGLDYSETDLFEKEYEILKVLGETPFEKRGIYFADPSYVTMRFCHTSPEKLYLGPLKSYNNKVVQRQRNEDLEKFLWRKYEQKVNECYSNPETCGRFIKNQDNIFQAMQKLINAYKNEYAGIAFITYMDFCKLKDNARLLNHNTHDMFEFYRKEIISDLAVNTSDKPEVEMLILNECLTNHIEGVNFCNEGLGICLENGKISKDLISIAQVPQPGLLTLNKQRTMNKIQDDSEMIQ